jgi:molybdopterin-guanine dinucleotide biosynthesis protein A
MGMDKAFLMLGGMTLVERVIDGLRPVCDELIVAVAAGDGERFASFLGKGVRVVEDSARDRGPIEGLRAGFAAGRGKIVAVAPTDAPLISPEFYELLIGLSKGYDAAVPFIGGLPESLLAVYWRVPMLAAIEDVLREGGRRPVQAFGRLRVRRVEEPELLGFLGPAGPFVNLNTPADYKRMEESFERRDGPLSPAVYSRSGKGSCPCAGERVPR